MVEIDGVRALWYEHGYEHGVLKGGDLITQRPVESYIDTLIRRGFVELQPDTKGR